MSDLAACCHVGVVGVQKVRASSLTGQVINAGFDNLVELHVVASGCDSVEIGTINGMRADSPDQGVLDIGYHVPKAGRELNLIMSGIFVDIVRILIQLNDVGAHGTFACVRSSPRILITRPVACREGIIQGHV